MPDSMRKQWAMAMPNVAKQWASDLDKQGLVKFARQIESGLLAEPGISLVELRGLRQPEIHVEISQARLRSRIVPDGRLLNLGHCG